MIVCISIALGVGTVAAIIACSIAFSLGKNKSYREQRNREAREELLDAQRALHEDPSASNIIAYISAYRRVFK